MTKKQSIPRYAVTIQDTHVGGITISAGSDDLEDFIRPYADEDKALLGVNNEIENMFLQFKVDQKIKARQEAKQ